MDFTNERIILIIVAVFLAWLFFSSSWKNGTLRAPKDDGVPDSWKTGFSPDSGSEAFRPSAFSGAGGSPRSDFEKMGDRVLGAFRSGTAWKTLSEKIAASPLKRVHPVWVLVFVLLFFDVVAFVLGQAVLLAALVTAAYVAVKWKNGRLSEVFKDPPF